MHVCGCSMCVLACVCSFVVQCFSSVNSLLHIQRTNAITVIFKLGPETLNTGSCAQKMQTLGKGLVTSIACDLLVADQFWLTVQCVTLELAILVEAGLCSLMSLLSTDDWRSDKWWGNVQETVGEVHNAQIEDSKENSEQHSSDYTNSYFKSLETSSQGQQCHR